MDSVIVLVLLGVIWAAVLIPPWLHGRREAQPAASIRVFRRQLWRLGEGPVAGARRERYGAVRFASDDGAVAYGPGGTQSRPPLDDLDDLDEVEGVRVAVGGSRFADVGFAELSPVDTATGDSYGYGGYDPYDDDAYGDDAGDGPGLGYGAGRRLAVPAAAGAVGAVAIALEPDWSSVGSQEPAGSAARRWAARFPQSYEAESDCSPGSARSRARAYRRRRQVMAVLVISVAVTLAWAWVLGMTGLWAAHAMADALLVGYVGLLVRLRRRSTERADKVRYLAPIEAPRPAVVVLNG